MFNLGDPEMSPLCQDVTRDGIAVEVTSYLWKWGNPFSYFARNTG